MRRKATPDRLRRIVTERAGERCEYCGLSQVGQEALFHVDHIRPVSAGGESKMENLALACVSWSLHKSDRQTGVDPETGELVRLFHPRTDCFAEHMAWHSPRVVGLTPTGRATVETLGMNLARVMTARLVGVALGTYPPPTEWQKRSDTGSTS